MPSFCFFFHHAITTFVHLFIFFPSSTSAHVVSRCGHLFHTSLNATFRFYNHIFISIIILWSLFMCSLLLCDNNYCEWLYLLNKCVCPIVFFILCISFSSIVSSSIEDFIYSTIQCTFVLSWFRLNNGVLSISKHFAIYASDCVCGKQKAVDSEKHF